ncbi:MAG: protein-disulfide reductase DsbD domain-containing protein, partial [Pseudomonadota bacterium]
MTLALAASRHLLRAATLLACVLLAAVSARADDFIPPEQAFRYTVRATGDALEVTWNVTQGYYLYRKRMGFATDTPGVTLGAAAFPKGLPHEDEFFGRQEVYRGANNVFRVPYAVAGARPAAIDLKLKLQGCADAGLCYPPSTWTTKVALPTQAAGAAGGAANGATGGASTSTAASGSGVGGALAGLLKPAEVADDGFLPPEQAYRASAERAGSDTIRVRFEIVDGYYLYRHRMG